MMDIGKYHLQVAMQIEPIDIIPVSIPVHKHNPVTRAGKE